MTVAERIREALATWGQSHREFARQMKRRGVRGGSYRSLLNYLKGSIEPSRRWLEEAAAITGVSFEWLLMGEGPKAAQIYNVDTGVDVRALFAACSPPWFHQEAGDLIFTSWYNAVRAIIQGTPEMETPCDSPNDTLLVIGKWLITNATHNHIVLSQKGASWSRTRFNQYYNMFFTTIASAAADPGEGVPVDELVALLQTEINAVPGRIR